MIAGPVGLERFLIDHGPAAVMAGAALEGDLTLILAGVIAHTGIFPFRIAVAAGALGTYVADCVWFMLGRWRGPGLRASRIYTRVGPGVERLARRFGPVQLVASRFVYGTRIASMVFWGLAGLPVLRFLLIDLAGAVLGALVFGLLGWGLSGSVTALLGHVHRIELLLLAVLVVGGGIVAWISWVARRRGERE